MTVRADDLLTIGSHVSMESLVLLVLFVFGVDNLRLGYLLGLAPLKLFDSQLDLDFSLREAQFKFLLPRGIGQGSSYCQAYADAGHNRANCYADRDPELDVHISNKVDGLML